MKLDDINDALETELSSEDFDSIGGLIIEQLERIPNDKESIQLENGIVLQAQGIAKNRILKVLKTRPYDGILQMLDSLQRDAYQMAVVSNKFDPTKLLISSIVLCGKPSFFSA